VYSNSTEDADTVLAKELNKLTFQEREHINEEIHGIELDQKYISSVQQQGDGSGGGETLHIIEETPEMLQEAVQGVQQELTRLLQEHHNSKQNSTTTTNTTVDVTAFVRSQVLYGAIPDTGTFLNETEFRIIILRVFQFDCHKAAIKLCDYATVVYEALGDVGLQRRMRLADFTPDELLCVRLGFNQVLPGRDRAGRRAYIHFAHDETSHFLSPNFTQHTALPFYDLKSRLKIAIYQYMNLLESDVASQRRGLIVVLMMHNISVEIRDFIVRGHFHQRCGLFPIRVTGIHYCFPSRSDHNTSRGGSDVHGRSSVGTISLSSSILFTKNNKLVLMANFYRTLAKQLSTYIRVHTGSPVECIYALKTFGIDSNSIPLNTSTNELDVTYLNQWLQLCQAKETMTTKMKKQIIDCPNHTDILSGRGCFVMNHPGNLLFRNIVQSKVHDYISCPTTKQSTNLTWDVLRLLKGQYCARFLIQRTIPVSASDGSAGTNNNDDDNDDDGGEGVACWVELSNEDARTKIRVAFRDIIKKQYQQQGIKVKRVSKRSSSSATSKIAATTLSDSSVTSMPRSIPSSSLASAMAVSIGSKRNMDKADDICCAVSSPIIAPLSPTFPSFSTNNRLQPIDSMLPTSDPAVVGSNLWDEIWRNGDDGSLGDEIQSISLSSSYEHPQFQQLQQLHQQTIESSTMSFLGMDGGTANYSKRQRTEDSRRNYCFFDCG